MFTCELRVFVCDVDMWWLTCEHNIRTVYTMKVFACDVDMWCRHVNITYGRCRRCIWCSYVNSVMFVCDVRMLFWYVMCTCDVHMWFWWCLYVTSVYDVHIWFSSIIIYVSVCDHIRKSYVICLHAYDVHMWVNTHMMFTCEHVSRWDVNYWYWVP